LEFIWNSLWHLLLNILVAINSVVNIPGVSIIIFTIFIRTLTIPLTVKSLKSSRNMQAIQPLMKEVQKKYKDDRQKQQEETMKLYREYGINPAAGCFPLLVQIPIFFGLFAALQFTLQSSANPAHLAALQAILWNPAWATAGFADFGTSSFLWVPSLAAADPLFIWPVLSGLFQFFQSRMAMPKRDPNVPQDAQQRMMSGMMQFMPIYITLISLGFPAGNVIYWAFSSLFGAVQQYFITGWGSLPDFPGFGFLPHKPMPIPVPPPLPSPGEPRRSGMFAKMMDRALEAQEARKAEEARAKLEGGGTAGAGEPTRPVTANARAERPRGSGGGGAATTRVRSKASEPNIRIVQSSGSGSGTSTVKYASDARPKSGNGAATTALPPKRKNKR
jgi:YidC/Oxa1 family membrane protein insertase